MQLNNLVIIPSAHPITHYSNFQSPNHPFSNPKSNTNISLNKQIAWKKSQSAFKKYKTKKDSSSKGTINSQSFIPIISQIQSTYKEEKEFFLIENGVNSSLKDYKNQQTLMDQQNFDYFDPNIAPYFQYGTKYILNSSMVKVQAVQNEQDLINGNSLLINTQDLHNNKLQKRKNDLNDCLLQQKLPKIQSFCCEKNVPLTEQINLDPFIILKNCRQTSRNFHQNTSGQTQKLSKKQSKKSSQNNQLKKTKPITKIHNNNNNKNNLIKKGLNSLKSYVNTQLNRSLSEKQFQNHDEKYTKHNPQKPYSVGYIDNYQKNKSFVSVQSSVQSQDQNIDDYDMGNQLNFVQFDLKKHLSSAYSVEESVEQSDYHKQSSYQKKKQQHSDKLTRVICATRSKITYPKEYYDSDKIIQEYDFSINDKDKE